MPSFLFACGVASPFRKCDSGRTLSHLSPTTFLEEPVGRTQAAAYCPSPLLPIARPFSAKEVLLVIGTCVFLSSLPKGGLLHIDLGRFRLALIDRLFVAGDLESVSFRALRSRFLAAGALSNSPPSILSIVRGASCLTIFPCPFCSTAALRVASFGSVPLGKSQRVVHSQWAPSSHSVLPGSSPRQGVVQGGYGGLFSGDHRAGGWWGEDRRPTRSGSPAPRFVGLLQLSLWKPGPAIGLSTYKGCAPWLR